MSQNERTNSPVIYSFAAVLFAVSGTISALTSHGTWYLILGALLMIGAAGAFIGLGVSAARQQR